MTYTYFAIRFYDMHAQKQYRSLSSPIWRRNAAKRWSRPTVWWRLSTSPASTVRRYGAHTLKEEVSSCGGGGGGAAGARGECTETGRGHCGRRGRPKVDKALGRQYATGRSFGYSRASVESE